MAYILGKDLDKWDESVITTAPFSVSESEEKAPQFMTGKDLLRSAKISQEWKTPVAISSQASDLLNKSGQFSESFTTAAVDSARNLVPNMANAFAQRALEITGEQEKPKSWKEKLVAGTEIGDIEKQISNLVALGIVLPSMHETAKEIREKAKTTNEAIELLDGREYPLTKYAQRIIAETTASAENRKFVRQLFNQAHGIDAEKWYNQAGSILGAMMPAVVAGRLGYKGARMFGAGRTNAANIGRDVLQGYMSAEMAGEYAEETAARYLEKTGDFNFENFTAKDATGLSSFLYGGIAGQIEVMGGVEPIITGAISKVGLRSGFGKAMGKIALGEATEEFLQGGLEILMRKMEGSTDKTWGQGLKEALTGAAWGALIGGSVGTTAFYVNRSNLVRGIREAFPKMTGTQAAQVADAMIDSVGEMATQDPTLRQNLRDKVSLMLRDVDLDNKEDRIDAMTDLEYSLIVMDAQDRGIELTDHEIFQGEVNELGWFREGIPEAQRAEIKSINDNILELKKQLEELNKAEKKDWAKIEETENKLAQASQYVLERVSDLAAEFKKLEDRYVEKEKQKALDAFEATQEQKELANSSASQVFNTLSNEGVNVQQINQGKATKHGAVYLQINPNGAKSFKIRLGVTPIGALHKSVIANFNVATMTPEQILARIRNLIENKYPQTNKKAKGGVNIGFGEEPMFQPEQFDLADENARLDDIYPAYEGEIIEVDGKERTVYNSNGDRIAKSKEALTNFWRWFGDSKVVDEQGRPLVVYHQTSEKFDTFMRGKDKAGKFDYETPSGFFFKSSDKNIGIAGNIQMPVYLKAEKSITFNNREQLQQFWVKNIDGYAELLDKYKNVDKEYNAKTDKIDEQLDKAIDDLEKSEAYKNATDAQQYQMRSDLVDNFDTTEFFAEWRNATDKIAEQMKQLVNDYVSANDIEMVKLENDSGAIGKKTTDSFIVFDSTQIKSVDNRGTYSADTGNIYYQETTNIRDRAIDPRWIIPKVRGGWTKEKILKYLKSVDSYSGAGKAAREIANFDTFEDFMNHVFYHGARYGTSGGLKPSITMSDREVERIGGGGYGEKYWAISVTKSKKVAGNFATSMGGGNIYPVLLAKNAKVIEMPELTDSVDLEDHIVDLYEKGIDAVWIGDKNAGEQELAVINPRALINIGSSEYYGAYKLGSEENPIRLNTEEDFRKIYEFAKNYKNMDENIRLDEARRIVRWQNRVSGAAPSTYRGAYIPEYRFILRANKMDASTLSHELAHDWMEVNFDRYRSGKQSKDFMKAWGALEKALGIPENATSVPRKASETFARAYEAWIVQNEDWTKFISVDDKDKDAVEKLMKDYQGELRDIYNDISNPYFKQTWGKLGELKPELKAWFDRVVNITDLDVMVERGEMTESQASAEKLNRAIDTVIENTVDEETKLALEEAKTLNDTARYEVEGGNQNSIQRRLSALAKEIDENGMTLKGDKYDTRRDMMAVAEAADNFVKTRLDDALAIINGQMAEVEGLYKEDLYTALERLAVENGDLGLIDELKNSEVANKLAKELGQRVAGFRNFKQSTDLDVVSALKSLDMKFNKALDNKKAKQEYDSALKLLDESLKQQDKIADKDLDNFLKDLECK